MGSKHTPGPWKVYKREEPIGRAQFEIHFSDDGECVAEVVHEEADANVMAASPDLLEALEHVMDTPEFKSLYNATQQMVLSAISKAYGR